MNPRFTRSQMRTPSGHVLIVDDTPKNLQVLGSVLRQAGHDVSVAVDGEKALEAVARARPDLILLDVIMPVMDGFAACRALKLDPDTSDIPVIFLTAKTETEDVLKGFELGAVDYVTKPFQTEELLQRVDTHLTLARLRAEREDRILELQDALALIKRLHREQEAFLRHEVNNALGPISGYAELLTDSAGDCLSERQMTWLAHIRDGTRMVENLLVAMKRLQSFEQEDVSLNLRRTDLLELIRDLLDTGIQKSGPGQLVFDVASDGPFVVEADRDFLPGVFTNLIKNALEHIAEHLDASDLRVRVTIAREDEDVLVSVHNGGPEIPADRLERFFDKFNSTKMDRGGTGLGTTYAAVVTRAHGGDISVTSTRRDGTTVSVRLPAC
ncbi:MAG: hypothetical protein COV99_10885 [Bacteroidetes bacterium CG12_big_fil_rev_8_21_14_0_65_60_17]|nr:MAG: hypothetical protein COV99_10885 [Bacteroidetes bacterium CG12_big_fil_rev_8_21_14_0_65_60_17]